MQGGRPYLLFPNPIFLRKEVGLGGSEVWPMATCWQSWWSWDHQGRNGGIDPSRRGKI